VIVRLSTDEYKALQKAAKQEGYTTVSAFVRAVTIGDQKGIMLQIQDDVRSILNKLAEKEKPCCEGLEN